MMQDTFDDLQDNLEVMNDMFEENLPVDEDFDLEEAWAEFNNQVPLEPLSEKTQIENELEKTNKKVGKTTDVYLGLDAPTTKLIHDRADRTTDRCRDMVSSNRRNNNPVAI